MQIDWWTLVLQGINFLILVWLLQRFLYKPVAEVIAKRRQLADRVLAEAETSKDEAEAARRRFEEDRTGLVQERQEVLEKAHGDLEVERAKIMEEAHREANELMETTRTAIGVERDAAIAGAREQVLDLSVALASRLLNAMVPEVLDDVFLQQVERELHALPDLELEGLRRGLGEEGALLIVVTAAPLASEAQNRWRGSLEAVLGHGEAVEFSTDPAIIGGAELRFPHTLLKLTWADQLEQAKVALCGDEITS